MLVGGWPVGYLHNAIEELNYREQILDSSRVNSLRSSAVYYWTLYQAPHGFGAPHRGFPAFLAPSNCLKTARLRRLQGEGFEPGTSRFQIQRPTPLHDASSNTYLS